MAIQVTRGLFDDKPIELVERGHGFKLTARSATPVGRPTFTQAENTIRFAEACFDSSPYWWGDVLRYAESRADWQERASQLMEMTGLARDTLRNLASICTRVAEPERALAPSVGHAEAIAVMPRREQREWLERSRAGGWTVRELRMEIKAASRRAVIDGQAHLEGQFRVIYADPPWSYGDAQPSGSKALHHYPTMTIAQLCALPIAAHALDASVLWLWVPGPLLLQNPGPREVIEAWGFTHKSGRVWHKVLGTYGHYVHNEHEHLLICTRGSCLPDRPTPALKSVVTERRTDEHSSKPESFRDDIEKAYDGPYLELFGRRRVQGWTVFGNDARLWAQDAAQSA